jgi:hypothetical protein
VRAPHYDAAAYAGLVVTSKGDFTAYGPRLAPGGLAAFLASTTTASRSRARRIADDVAAMTAAVTAMLGGQSAFVIVRTTVDTPKWDVPRWHQDGPYFDSAATGRKWVMALLGPPTLFCSVPRDARARLERETMGMPSLKDRARVAAYLRARGAVVRQARPGFGTVYRYGLRGDFHSEPPTHTSRIFVSVIPGTRADVESRRRQDARPQTQA